MSSILDSAALSLRADQYQEISAALDSVSIAEAIQRAASAIDFPFAQVMIVVPEARPVRLVFERQSTHMIEFDRAVLVHGCFGSARLLRL